MKIFSIYYLLAGVSFGMPMANQDQDSFDEKMAFRKMMEQQEQVNKIIEESLRDIQESNRRMNYMYKNMFKINADNIEEYGN